jgi:putative transposase
MRAITLADDFTRECLAVELGFSFGSREVIRCFEDIAFERGFPETIRFDNGSEFTSHAMLRWDAERDTNLHLIDPGKPTQDAQIESLNGKIRDELLNAHCFTTIFEARRRAADWRQDYNEIRPHSALGYRTPREFAAEFQTKNNSHRYQLRKTPPQVRRIIAFARGDASAAAPKEAHRYMAFSTRRRPEM